MAVPFTTDCGFAMKARKVASLQTMPLNFIAYE
jgi:hypothetical protein